PPMRLLLAGAVALGIAFTGTWWGQGNGFEVYSLHALLMPLTVIACLRFVNHWPAEREPWITRQGTMFAALVGLSFTDHLTTDLLAPGLIAYYMMAAPRGKLGAWLKRLIGLIPGFLLGLLPYAWLPLRASMRPWFNWGNPATAEALWNHVRGKQYSI